MSAATEKGPKSVCACGHAKTEHNLKDPQGCRKCSCIYYHVADKPLQIVKGGSR